MDNFAQALCRYVNNPDIFFPERGLSPELAKRVCAHCAVRKYCLQYALDAEINIGIWGGLSEEERKPFYKERG